MAKTALRVQPFSIFLLPLFACTRVHLRFQGQTVAMAIAQDKSSRRTQSVAIDIGGTFTDLVAYRFEDRSLVLAKSLTTYHDLFEGIGACVAKGSADLAQAAFFKHGTTLVINTLLERTGGPAALVTTRGFRDVLEMARGNRAVTYDLFYRRHAPLVPRHLCFELAERTDGQGKPLSKPDQREIEELAGRLAATGVRAVGVSFLNSYLAPDHEREVTEALRRLLPGVFVTCGSDLSREWYEYERTATAAANAYVGPRMAGYLGQLETELSSRGFSGSAFMMGSSGGVLSLARAAEEPIMLVESGPIGGCIGASVYARELNLRNVIAFDMGGTTAKCALVCDGRFDVKSVYYVGGYERGFPIRGAVIDIVEVGAGGGSIAHLDEQGRLSVGPRSAGSSPGPVAYGKGGIEPTVTDANLVLGRLDAKAFLGGEMALDGAAAKRAIDERIAAPLGFDAETGGVKAAAGILAIAGLTMAGAIKKVAIERGRDPREFALFAYGGGGPLHAAELARELHIPLVIVPPEPGNFSAIGMLLADARRDASRTLLRPLSDDTIAEIQQAYLAIEAPLRAALEQETAVAGGHTERVAELRYRGQIHSVGVPMDSIKKAVELRSAFESAYKARFGHADGVNPVDLVGIRSTVSISLPRPELETLRPDRAAGGRPMSHLRSVYFAQAAGFLSTRVYARRSLPVGFSDTGPAVIQEYGSATLVGPDDEFEIGALGEIRTHIRAGR